MIDSTLLDDAASGSERMTRSPSAALSDTLCVHFSPNDVYSPSLSRGLDLLALRRTPRPSGRNKSWGAVFLTLLLLPFLAPACAPNEPPSKRTVPKNLVLLTDTSRWEAGRLVTYKDSLGKAGYRVLVSGYAGESAAELTARLPWLLQPGVDLFIYDNRLAGKAGKDSLVSFLKASGHPAGLGFLK